MLRVLITEDDVAIRNLLRAIAERNGCDTAVAADGAEALAMLQQSRFDLVLLDLMMPVMNGYELLPHLRNMAERPAVLVVTAMVGDRFLDLDSDIVTAIVHKPFDADVLGSLIAQVARSVAAKRGNVAPPDGLQDDAGRLSVS